MASPVHSQQLNLPSLRDEAYHLLRDRILNHEYPPNHRFNLNELEAQLGISRTPLKEALHRLEMDGLVTIRPRRGTYVTAIDVRDVAESFDVRAMLECAAAESVVENASDDEIARLRAINDEMIRLAEQDDYYAMLARHIELDQEMHRLYISCARNRRLMAIYDQIDTHLQVARVQRKFHPPDTAETRREHEAILQALEDRDAEALRAAMKAHITTSKVRMLKVLAESDGDGLEEAGESSYG